MSSDIRPITDTSAGQCGSHLNVRGEDFRCDLATDHNGWAHSSQASEALWSNATPADVTR
ncbi:hypothetical protein QUV83_08130 [Cellulomonas cellasea]|uniref:hypothetical protein n=1 Tax=Cellulomonas cellasea TaxID=43670 RepID=UPI0025A371FC|nr:hypothetical protein [Cellulomonas cellasea]MDM8084727.1 hypothetical protein [Cellulomonas cellasea]